MTPEKAEEVVSAVQDKLVDEASGVSGLQDVLFGNEALQGAVLAFREGALEGLRCDESRGVLAKRLAPLKTAVVDAARAAGFDHLKTLEELLRKAVHDVVIAAPAEG